NDGWWGHTIGSEWGDFDNDGDLDLITANLAHPRYIEFSNRTCLYENRLDEDGIFREVRGEWGIKYEETHSDPAWGDVDADGDLDLYLTSVYPNRRSFLYLNDFENQRFIDVTYLAGVRITNGWGCAFSDFDNDGDLDLAVGSNDGVHLFRNRGTDRHWIEFEVRAAGGACGTRLILKRGQETQLREISGGKGTTSQHSRIVYFGLGESDKPVNLEVRFPSGEVVNLKGLGVDRRIVITPP
ncbi:MAG TPA: CRTAC1 family protein, partial [Bacteroidetes bacterium]|nr:CRTAC1 family protein [Bacteroidota bacterium]